jgi:GNAT superfamily N-acetyltransferase
MELARPARQEDIGVCTDLLTRALDAAREMRGGTALAGDTSPEQLLARWTVESDAGAVLMVGEFHQAVVGVGAAMTGHRHRQTALTGRIECCYVEEEARGVGVGSALMDAMVEWCERHGCADIDALALPGDRSSKQRLEAAGFSARLLTLNRRLN